YLGRMVQAWAQASTGCASAPSASAEGGAAPYWESYEYSTTGNLTGITSTTAAGAVTTTADTYPAAGSAQPHAITGRTVTAPSGHGLRPGPAREARRPGPPPPRGAPPNRGSPRSPPRREPSPPPPPPPRGAPPPSPPTPPPPLVPRSRTRSPAGPSPLPQAR